MAIKDIANKITIIVCFTVLIIVGIVLNKNIMANSRTLNAQYEKINQLKDPSLDNNGKTVLGTYFYNFELKDLNNVTYKLDSINSLLVLLVYFDINDCILCLNEYRLWQELNRKYPKDILTVLGICRTREKSAIDNFVNNKNISFPVLWDPENIVKREMNFRKSPLRIILDTDHKILDCEYTLTTNEQQLYVLRYIDKLVSEKLGHSTNDIK